MINCKNTLIATYLTLVLPMTGWAAAPVVDDSGNFAMSNQGQASKAPDLDPHFDDENFDNPRTANRNNTYAANNQPADSALVKEEQYPEVNSDTGSEITDNAKLIEKILSLQKEVQELRGLLEVQAHDLKLLQEQQLSFYKDLDSRLSTISGKGSAKTPTDLSVAPKAAPVPSAVSAPKPVPAATPEPTPAVSHANPADEQISYLAAYEFVQKKQFDAAINAMQAYTQKYPSGSYTANAQYWLGELYLVKKEYPKAIEHFQVVLDKFPTSSKAAASLLKSAYAYADAGQKEEAVKRLQEVIDTYSGTATADLARDKLNKINP